MIYTGYLNDEKFFDTSSDYEGYTVTAAQVELELGASGSATFGVPPVNIFYGNFNKLADSISVYRGDEEIFFGRVYGVSGELNTVHTVTCEGYLAVLNDSIFEPDTYECSLEELIGAIIENHNAKCPDWPLAVGTLEFKDDYVYRAYEEYESSKSRFDDLMDSYGGYLVCRKEDDTVYLDWLDSDNTAEEGQEINFGENLLDITQESTADDIITALIPIGATVTEESDDEDEEDTEYTVDITSVNDGLNYIYDEDAVKKFGWIWGTYTWSDVEEPSNLLTKAAAYLAEQCESKVTISVSAVDLSEAGYDYDSFNIGVKNPVVSSPHGIDESFLCVKLSINCLNRTSSTMELGGTRDGIVSTSSKNYSANAKLIEKITANYATNNALSVVSQKVTQNTTLINQNAYDISLLSTQATQADVNLAMLLSEYTITAKSQTLTVTEANGLDEDNLAPALDEWTFSISSDGETTIGVEVNDGVATMEDSSEMQCSITISDAGTHYIFITAESDTDGATLNIGFATELESVSLSMEAQCYTLTCDAEAGEWTLTLYASGGTVTVYAVGIYQKVSSYASTQLTLLADSITAEVEELIDGVDVTSLIRATSSGIEVAKLEDGEYTSTKTVITDTGLSVTSTIGDVTFLETLSSGVNLYADSALGAKITSSGLKIYYGGELGCSISSNSQYGTQIKSEDGILCTAEIGQICVSTYESEGHITIIAQGENSSVGLSALDGDITFEARGGGEVLATPYGSEDTYAHVVTATNGETSHIEAGYDVITCAANDSEDSYVEFTNSFSATPYIVVTPRTGYTSSRLASVHDTSKSGFYIRAYNGTSSSVDLSVNWIAIGQYGG